MAVVLAELHGGILYGAAHPLNMALGPMMFRLWEPVFDATCLTDHVEAHRPGDDRVSAPRRLYELDAIIGQDCVDLMRGGLEHVLQELPGDAPVSLCDELGRRQVARAKHAIAVLKL